MKSEVKGTLILLIALTSVFVFAKTVQYNTDIKYQPKEMNHGYHQKE
jgi:hypothetical protein